MIRNLKVEIVTDLLTFKCCSSGGGGGIGFVLLTGLVKMILSSVRTREGNVNKVSMEKVIGEIPWACSIVNVT